MSKEKNKKIKRNKYMTLEITKRSQNPVAEFFSSRSTPDTDASRGYALSSHYGRIEGSYLQMDRSGPFVHAEVARKLERERDEAREAFKISYNERVQMELERDEARKKYDTLAVENMLEVHKLCKERDKAMEVLRQIKASDWKTSGELRGMARIFLDGIK